MANRRFWGAIVAAAFAAACGGKTTTDSGPAKPESKPADPRGVLLELLERDTLTSLAPPEWTRPTLFPAGYDQGQIIELSERAGDELGVVPAAVIAISIEHDLANQIACAKTCKRVLFHAYIVMRFHAILGRDFLAQSLAATDLWSDVQADKKTEVEAYMKSLIDDMARRSRALAAELVKAGELDAQQLLRLARVEQATRAYDTAAALAAYMASLETATAPQLLDAAEMCFRSKDLACGDRLHGRAKQATAGREAVEADRWAEVDKTRESAHRAAELASATGPGRRELAGLLVELERVREAEALYTKLVTAYPKDAQMALGLARIQRVRQMSDEASNTILAAGPDNRDVGFYRSAAGILAHKVFRQIATEPDKVRALVPRFRQLLADFAKHEPDRARMLGIGLDLVLDLTDPRSKDGDDWVNSEALQRAIAEIHAARGSFPKSIALARMSLFLSILDKDEKRKEASVKAIAAEHASTEELADLIRSAQILLGPEGRASVLESLGKLPSPSGEQKALFADLTAAETPTNEPARWQAIVAIYADILSRAKTNDGRLVSNLGTAIHHAGNTAQAREAWSKAIQLGAENPAPGINLYATGEQEREQLWAWIEPKLNSPGNDTARLARRWKIRLTVKDKKERRKQLAALEAEPRGPIVSAPDSAVLSVDYEIGIGYSDSEDLQINSGLGVSVWLVVTPPETPKKKREKTRR